MDDFGLTLRELARLGSTPVEVRGYLRYPDPKKLFRYAPAERVRRIREHHEKQAGEVLKRWPSNDVQVLRSSARAYGIAGTIAARDVSKLLPLTQLEGLSIEKIGRRKRRRRRRRTEPWWFAVKAIFAIQVEDKTSGLEDYEERIILVKARFFDDAVRRLRKEFRLYASPYLNAAGEMVRWHFEKVLDVYDTGEEELSALGTEVFSTIRSRRIRAEQVWRPRRS